MGLLLVNPRSKTHSKELLYSMDYTEGKRGISEELLYQGIIIKFKKIYKQFVFLYIRTTPSDKETNEISKKFESFDGIIGDLNLNPAIENENKRLATMCGDSKVMELKEITTNNLVQLDHILRRKDFDHELYATSYNNFATDHRSIVLRIGNTFLAEFLQYINFDSDNHAKIKTVTNMKVNTRQCKETPLKQQKKINKNEIQRENETENVSLHRLNPEEWLDDSVICYSLQNTSAWTENSHFLVEICLSFEIN
jgi:hypothetical protein